MVRTTIKKSIYQPFEYIGENVIRIMFDREDMMEDIRDEKGEPTGEQKETDYCTVLMEIFYYKPSQTYIKELLSKSVPIVNLSEAQIILSNLGNGTTDSLKDILFHNIETYDSSSDVNDFSIQGKHMWLDKATRVGLQMRFQSEQLNGKTETTLWTSDGESFTLGIDDAMSMLYQLEEYASKCYDNTMKHIANVKQLVSDDDIISYDFKVGYPDKLVF